MKTIVTCLLFVAGCFPKSGSNPHTASEYCRAEYGMCVQKMGDQNYCGDFDTEYDRCMKDQRQNLFPGK